MHPTPAPRDQQTLLFVLVGAPFESDMLATLFRVVEEALVQGHKVVVWACGYATAVTLRTLGERKPRNPFQWDADYPSTARLVCELWRRGEGRLEWLVCRQCLEERGATEQIDEVKVQAPFRVLDYLQSADVRLVLRGR